jgi:hypothetical protein
MTGSDQYSRLGADPGVFQDLLGRVPGKNIGWSTINFITTNILVNHHIFSVKKSMRITNKSGGGQKVEKKQRRKTHTWMSTIVLEKKACALGTVDSFEEK